ncbi:Hypothetical predicted protein [Paramuricea clavata]|uniref:Uncharacterized protein n=1 Tax=Paramuricea clavata TaxID=317549 RepID=A0A7D9HRP4_PARCT|nr:Hypothetical predicted protein [Paramuricea clavata]
MTRIPKHDENVQAEINAENSNPLLTGGGDRTGVATKVIKRCRFRRRALRFIMIGRCSDATRQLMEQGGSRATIKKNLGDILETFKESGPLHTQLEEHLQDDEQLLDDMMTLADIKLEVNTITGWCKNIWMREHQDPTIVVSFKIVLCVADRLLSYNRKTQTNQDEFDKQYEENRETDEQRKRAPRYRESCPLCKASRSIRELKPDVECRRHDRQEEEDWIPKKIQFQKDRNVELRTVWKDPS